MIENFPAGFDFEFSSVIVIADEIVSRNDRSLIGNRLNESVFMSDDAPVLIVVLMLAQTLLAAGVLRSVRYDND